MISLRTYVELLVFYARMLVSRKYVSMVLRYNLLADLPYATGHVVDRGRDRPIESFAVHPPSIILVEQWFLGGSSFVLDLLGKSSGCSHLSMTMLYVMICYIRIDE
jgi:hypothetical protein